MRFEKIVAAFETDLATPGVTPEFAHGRERVPDARRFQVYRNNVAAALIGALEARFPVVRRLVGEAFFRAMAGAYVARHKPASALLIVYGADFPDFVQNFEPAQELPYLGDVARLENAWIEAYHAAEAEPVTLADLSAIPPERVGDLTFVFHPSATLLAFQHPAASIWAAHQGEGEPRPVEHWSNEDALIVRPDAEVVVRALPPRALGFARALQAGVTLAEAAAPLAEAGDDVGAHFVGLIEAGAIARLLLADA